MMADLLAAIAEGWGWRGIEPVAVIDRNAFGNLIVQTKDGGYWRICPEELNAKHLAASEREYREARSDPEFVRGWEMTLLVRQAKEHLGDPGKDRCYCLKIPGVLGGAYEPDNFGTITLMELIGVSGDLARQIDDVPDGAQVKLVIR